jgi:mono/diheme cytochrome c family protein
MRTLLKVVGWILAVVVVLGVAGVAFFFIRFPKRADPPEVTVDATPELLARGEYLFRSVAQCGTCHSLQEPRGRYEVVDESTLGQGGTRFPLGEAGLLYAKNITPAALGDWTDGELIRAIRDGVSKDGTALFPLMPYLNYRRMSQEDLSAVVAYTRSLKPIQNAVPERELNFPMSLIVRMIPGPAEWPPPPAPPRAESVAYGEYVFTIAACAECHTPRGDRGEPLPGLELSGGSEFPSEEWIVRAANITPDTLTGIGRWSRDDFVARFKSIAMHPGPGAQPSPGEPVTPMPWVTYSLMTEEDLASIYAYLRTATPVERRIERFERATRGTTE